MTAEPLEVGEVLADGCLLLAPAGVRVTALAFRHALVRMRVNGLPLPADAAAVVELLKAAGSGQRAEFDMTPEPRTASSHDQVEWLSTGDVADAVGLSSSYLRRLARRGHPGARPSADGWLWHRDQLPSPGDRRAR